VIVVRSYEKIHASFRIPREGQQDVAQHGRVLQLAAITGRAEENQINEFPRKGCRVWQYGTSWHLVIRPRDTLSYACGLGSYPNLDRNRNPLLKKYRLSLTDGYFRRGAFRITTIIIEPPLNPVVMRKSGRRELSPLGPAGSS